MADPVALKYRAFISYSHADTSQAKWLHRGLEGFRVDKDLAGRKTAMGTISNALRPIFRDRDEFSAGHTLSELTLAALDASAAMIVICSPASAKSSYVNKEIGLFKSRHPERPVIPLIVAGKPGDPELECFPSTLKFKLDTEGQITDEPVELLAADAREEGDGKALALAKVVAGLLGLSADEVFRRAERQLRRKARVRNGIIATLAILAVAAAGSAVYAWQQLKVNEAFLNETLQVATEIVDTAVAQATTYGVPRTTTLAMLTKAEGLFDVMARRGRQTPELRYRKAWMLIEFARNYAILGDTTKWRQRAEEAHRLLAGLAEEQPYQSNQKVLAASLAVAHQELGTVFFAQGNLEAALANYEAGLAIADRLVEADPSNAGWQRVLSVSYNNVGKVRVAQGHLTEALKSYQDSLAIAERLANADPSNVIWQHDLSVSNSGIGDVLMTQGNLTEALKFYQDSRAIFERLAKTNPSNAGSQRDLFASYLKVSDVLLLQGNLAEARNSYQASLAIIERLAKADPSNADAQRDLLASYSRIGDVLKAESNLAAALKAYQDSLAIAERLAKADPSNAEWQQVLSLSYLRVGDVRGMQGNLAEALKSYQDGLAIAERLANADPGNVGYQRDLYVGYHRVALILSEQGEKTRALETARQGRAIIARLIKQSPDNVQLAKALASFDDLITKLQADAQPEMMQPTR